MIIVPRRPFRSKRIKDKTFDPRRLNDAQCEYLTHGSLMFEDSDALGFPETDLAKFKTLWRCYRALLMGNWAADPYHAGRRPWAWWQFEAPEPVPIIASGSQLAVGRAWAWADPEPELVYLIRLNLIQPWELPGLKDMLDSGRFNNSDYARLMEHGCDIKAILRQYLQKEGVTLATKANPQQKPLAGAQC
jgi:hypothetical protein